jgi:hypothetical protein
MYEMEGASQSRESAEHTTIARQSLGEPRATRCPPPESLLPGAARQLGNPAANPGLRVPAFAKLPILVLADPEISLRAGSPSLVA